ncbi:MAG: response regulator [Lachnospiraceae bacterium]|nr:response regulator [Lachnospiraceae bacterium]
MYEVLIVEDDPMVAMINKQYVNQNSHFHVTGICKDGKSALEYLENNTVHLLILDQFMPQMNGLTLLRLIKEKDIPVSVIMVTAANDSASIEEALRLGIVDYLVKPFYNSRFQQALETFLNRQDAFHDLSAFKQHHIDALLENNLKSIKSNEQLPKGIQEQTLDKMYDFMKANSKSDFTSDLIADHVGLSRVTVRRYMNYLLEQNYIVGHMNYETGGRPCMLYRWNK